MIDCQNLTDVQQHLGLTRTELAAVLGVHYQTLTKWQRGEQKPPAVAVQMARLLCWLHARGLLSAWRRFCRAKQDQPEQTHDHDPK